MDTSTGANHKVIPHLLFSITIFWLFKSLIKIPHYLFGKVVFRKDKITHFL